jgi:protein O-mannosyl-transferase
VPVLRRRALLALALGAATVAVYAPLRHHGFVDYDDPLYITGNPHLGDGLSPSGLRWAFLEPYERNWIPLTWTSLLASYELYGLDPAGYHLTDLALHVASALVLFWVLSGWTGAPGRSAFVAGVFALHPLHVESVAWATERKDTLAGLFWMLTLWTYGRYARRPGAARYAAVAALLGLGLLAKPLLVTLPFVLLLLDGWPLGRLRDGETGRLDRRALGRACLEKIPLLIGVVAFSVVTYRVQQQTGAMSDLADVPLAWRVQNALLSYVAYLGKALWPVDLSVFYPHPLGSLPTWQPLAAGALLAALSAGAVWAAPRRPYLPVGWFWYLGTLVPMIGLVQVGLQGMADRYTYIPLVGAAIAVAWGVWDLAVGRGLAARAGAAVAAAGALAALAATTAVQLEHWRDTEPLFRQALRVTRDNYVAHQGLGNHLLAAGRTEEAIEELAEATRLRPRWAMARGNLADALVAAGRLDTAILNYQQALRDDPGSVRLHAQLGKALAARGWPDQALTHYAQALRLDDGTEEAGLRALIGQAELELGHPAAAAVAFERALSLDPGLASVQRQLAAARLRAGDAAGAVRAARAALAASPDSPDLQLALADTLAGAGRPAEAVGHYREALRLRPAWVAASNNLAWLLATSPEGGVRDPGEALRLAEEAADATGRRDPSVLDTLAVSQAAAGRFDAALATLDTALALAADARDDAAIATLGEHRAALAAGRTVEGP